MVFLLGDIQVCLYLLLHTNTVLEGVLTTAAQTRTLPSQFTIFISKYYTDCTKDTLLLAVTPTFPNSASRCGTDVIHTTHVLIIEQLFELGKNVNNKINKFKKNI